MIRGLPPGRQQKWPRACRLLRQAASRCSCVSITMPATDLAQPSRSAMKNWPTNWRFCCGSLGSRGTSRNSLGASPENKKIAASFRVSERHDRCPFISSESNLGERLVHLHNLNFIPQLGPAAEHIGILLGMAAGVLRLPVAQKDVVLIVVAVEQVAPVAFAGDNGHKRVEGL